MNFVEIAVPDWVISDTHFGHARILDICPGRRVFASTVAQHDDVILAGWRQCVLPQQTILHLGDFMLGTRVMLREYGQQMTGRCIITLGNHDRSGTAMREAGFALTPKAVFFTRAGIRYWCCHRLQDVPYPFHRWREGDRILCGHSHDLPLPEHPLRAHARNMGIDALGSPLPFSVTVLDHRFSLG